MKWTVKRLQLSKSTNVSLNVCENAWMYAIVPESAIPMKEHTVFWIRYFYSLNIIFESKKIIGKHERKCKKTLKGIKQGKTGKYSTEIDWNDSNLTDNNSNTGEVKNPLTWLITDRGVIKHYVITSDSEPKMNFLEPHGLPSTGMAKVFLFYFHCRTNNIASSTDLHRSVEKVPSTQSVNKLKSSLFKQ